MVFTKEVMSAARRTPSGLLVSLLLLTALSPIAMVQAVPTEPSEYYYGVEYDWSSLDSDVQNVTGLDIQDLFTEIMADADEAGFNLDIGQLITGATNIYVHQTEDVSVQTIQDINGDDVQVWSRTSDVVVRHGVLSNDVLMTDWSETTFGSEPTSFDTDVLIEAENVVTVDILYTEYLNNDYHLIGADMDIDMMVGHDMNLGVDVVLEGGGERLDVDFDTGMDFTYSISSDAEWRLGNPSPIYVEASQNEETSWHCVESASEADVFEEWGETYVDDHCGTVDGTYIGSADYNVYFTGLPMEEFGFDEGQFDITVTDAFSSEGDYEEDAEMDGVRFDLSADETLEVDLGDGEMLDVTPCTSCPPGNPVMFVMMGNVLGHASTAFGEAVAEDFEDALEDSVGEIFENIFGGGDGGDDDYYDDEEPFYCDNGEAIHASGVNDGYDHCSDGSDEDDFFLNSITTYNYDVEDVVVGFQGSFDATQLGYQEDREFTCYDGDSFSLDQVNDGWDDCYFGEDENANADAPDTYMCEDGTEVAFELVNDGSADCADGSDEPVDNIGQWFLCDNYDRIPFQYVNDGTPHCSEGDDEHNTRQSGDFHCDEYDTSLNFTLVNDGTVDCGDGADEGEAIFQLMDFYVSDDEGNVLASVEDLMLCASWSCDISMSVDSGFVHHESEVPAPSVYGHVNMCIGATIYDADGSVLTNIEESCNSVWMGGPAIEHYGTYMNDNGDNSLALHITAEDYDNIYNDVTVMYEVHEMTDAGSVVVATDSVAFDDESSVEFDRVVDISNPGEYCLHVYLTQTGEDDPYDTYSDCITIEEQQEPSDKINTIAEAFGESSIGDVFEAFGENLGSTFESIAENEAPEFPYVDGMWAPLWSTEHATIVGVGLYASDEDGNDYILAGPTTTGYSEDRPMTFASIRYITGVSAQEAQTEMAEFDDLEDIVDVDQHDLAELEQVLEDAGANTDGLGLTDGTSDTSETTDEEEETTPPTAEEVAEDSGLLPFVSPLTVMAMIGLAAIAGNRRRTEE